ncbi:MAG: hypothetical protein R6W73_06210 [Candidatus Saliniplasma sp.]
MGFKLILEYLYSNKATVVVIILIPIILSLAYGNILYNEDHLGSQEKIELPRDSDTCSEDMISQEKEEILNNDVKTDLIKLEEKRFKVNFYSSISSVASIAIVLGGIVSSLFVGKMMSDKSIIYILTNKSSKEKSYLETISILIPFVLIIGVVSSLAIVTLTLREFPEKSISLLFFYTFIIFVYSLLSGYALSLTLSILFKNEVIPILGVIGYVVTLPSLNHGLDILIPMKNILLSHIYNVDIDLNWSFLGLTLFVVLFMVSYIGFKRGDFYK